MKRWIAAAVVVAVAVGVVLCTHSRTSEQADSPRPETPSAAPAEGTTPEPPPDTTKPADRSRADAPPAETAPAPTGAPRPVVVHVVGEDGAPYSAAMVWEEGKGPTGRDRTTGADGSVTVTLPPGRHTLVARGLKTGSSSASVDVPPGDGSFDGPTIALGPGLTIRGRVVDDAGTPLGWVRVRCFQQGDDAPEGDFLRHGRRYLLGGDDVLTDERGEFALRGLEDAPHEVHPDLSERPGWTSEPPSREGVRPGDDGVEFRLVPFARVAGQVIDAVTKAPIARFEFGWGREIRDADGRFRESVGPTPGSPPKVEIRARGHLPFERTLDDLKSGDAIDLGTIALEPDPDTGTLLLEFADPSATPVTHVRIDGGGPDFRMWSETCDDPSGRVRAEGLKAGQHTWWAYGDGISTASGTVAVAPGEERLVHVVLARAGSIRLRILAKDGRPETFVQAQVLDGGRNPVSFRFVFDRPQGTALAFTEWRGVGPLSLSEADGRLGGLAPGQYTLRIESKGVAPREVPIEIPATGETKLDVPAGE